MLPSDCCRTFAAEALVLRGLWGEKREGGNLSGKASERKAQRPADSPVREGAVVVALGKQV